MTDTAIQESATHSAVASRVSLVRFGSLAERFGLVLLLTALIIFFAVNPTTSDSFLAAANLRALAGNQTVTAILALAAIIPLAAGQFDVSIGASLGLSSVLIAKLVSENGQPIWVAVLVALALGCLIGAILGALIAGLDVNSFVITLGMATFLGGVVTWYTAGETLVGMPQTMLDFGNKDLAGVPRPVCLLVLVAVALAYIMRYTIFGRHLLWIGENRQAARLVGVNTSQRVILAFVACGGLAALAGAVQLARTGSASSQVGSNFTLAALAAAFLGATTITPGRFNVLGTLVGVLFVGVAVNGFTLMGVADWVEPVFNGVMVITAVSLGAVMTRRRARS